MKKKRRERRGENENENKKKKGKTYWQDPACAAARPTRTRPSGARRTRSRRLTRASHTATAEALAAFLLFPFFFFLSPLLSPFFFSFLFFFSWDLLESPSSLCKLILVWGWVAGILGVFERLFFPGYSCPRVVRPWARSRRTKWRKVRTSLL